MTGFITETNLDEAEIEFPGIAALYGSLRTKPRTFLDLLQLYLVKPRSIVGAGLLTPVARSARP